MQWKQGGRAASRKDVNFKLQETIVRGADICKEGLGGMVFTSPAVKIFLKFNLTYCS